METIIRDDGSVYTALSLDDLGFGAKWTLKALDEGRLSIAELKHLNAQVFYIVHITKKQGGEEE